MFLFNILYFSPDRQTDILYMMESVFFHWLISMLYFDMNSDLIIVQFPVPVKVHTKFGHTISFHLFVVNHFSSECFMLRSKFIRYCILPNIISLDQNWPFRWGINKVEFYSLTLIILGSAEFESWSNVVRYYEEVVKFFGYW